MLFSFVSIESTMNMSYVKYMQSRQSASEICCCFFIAPCCILLCRIKFLFIKIIFIIWHVCEIESALVSCTTDRIWMIFKKASCASILLEWSICTKDTKTFIDRLLAHLRQRPIGEHIVYPWSGVRPSSVVHNAQTSSSLKPLGQSKPNFMWSLLW